MYETQRDNELKHYGVIGMKWGVRRARKTGGTYQYKSHGTKKYERKAAKATGEKKKLYQNRAKRSAELDRKFQKEAERMSTGKTVANTLVTGVFGMKTYRLAKAAGNTRGESAAATIISSYLGGPLGNMAANALIRSDYIRKGE